MAPERPGRLGSSGRGCRSKASRLASAAGAGAERLQPASGRRRGFLLGCRCSGFLLLPAQILQQRFRGHLAHTDRSSHRATTDTPTPNNHLELCVIWDSSLCGSFFNL